MNHLSSMCSPKPIFPKEKPDLIRNKMSLSPVAVKIPNGENPERDEIIWKIQAPS